jgi:hypothetical protein
MYESSFPESHLISAFQIKDLRDYISKLDGAYAIYARIKSISPVEKRNTLLQRFVVLMFSPGASVRYAQFFFLHLSRLSDCDKNLKISFNQLDLNITAFLKLTSSADSKRQLQTLSSGAALSSFFSFKLLMITFTW